MRPRFFATPSEFRTWLEAHHATTKELLVGFHKKGSGKPSITWPEAVDEALSFGWIDGVRRSLDDVSYTNRFTPRTARSTWSVRNIERARELIAQGRMHPAGRKAFEAEGTTAWRSIPTNNAGRPSSDVRSSVSSVPTRGHGNSSRRSLPDIDDCHVLGRQREAPRDQAKTAGDTDRRLGARAHRPLADIPGHETLKVAEPFVQEPSPIR